MNTIETNITPLTSGRRATVIRALGVGMAAMTFVVMLGAAKKGCGHVAPTEPVCDVPADCQGLPHPDCEGGWSCTKGECSWSCEGPKGCYSDNECPSGKVCNAGDVCLPPPGCKAGMACPAVCYGQCVEPKPDEGCKSDNDCAKGEMCAIPPCMEMCDAAGNCGVSPSCKGQCVKKPTDCQSDSDCGSDEYCNVICPFVPPCFGMCTKKETGCLSDKDCGANQTCSLPTCPPCPPGALCKPCAGSGVCIDNPTGCKSDADCGANQSCQQLCPMIWCVCTPGDANCTCPAPDCTGTCVDKPNQCKVDSDCAAGETCVLGPCPMAPCTPDWCPPCYGTCQKTEPTGCTSDWDCAKGQICQKDGCPEWFCGCAGNDPACDCAPPPLCLGTCVNPPTNKCETDKDCAADQFCQIEACTACACPAGVPCDCIATCIGSCQPKETTSCGSDQDCPAGESCQCFSDPSCPMCDVCLMKCAPKPEQKCNTNMDCAEGTYCEVTMCSGCACPAGATDCDCPPPLCYGTCQPTPTVTPCGSDKDCAGNESCQCLPPPGCPMCDACMMQCAPTQCTDDSQCGDGYACQNQICPKMPCTADGVCPPCYGTCEATTEPPDPTPSACFKGGCSGELCTSTPDMAGICIWNDSFACYQKYGNCGQYGANGGCGWEMTPELKACLASFQK